MARIAIDYTPAYQQGGGIGRYVRELTAALATEDTTSDYRLFASGADSKSLPHLPGKNFTWKTTRLSPGWLARIWHRLHIPLSVNRFVGNVDLYHATDFVLPPTTSDTKTLLTVHDLSFIHTPETASPQLKAYLERVVPLSVRKATHILADSQATKNDLIDFYQTPSAKITVLHGGVSAHFKRINNPQQLNNVREKYQLGKQPYIFSVGTVQPRKNYSRVIKAITNLHQQGYDIKFVIAGGKGWLQDTIYQTIQETQMREHIKFTGFADDEDLPALYSEALCTAFPSLYEGFGFPVLESMACGTPVITSNISSLPEVAGDAALLVNPLNIEEITNSLKQMIDDSSLRAQLMEKGYQRVKKFTWQQSAQQLKLVYKTVLAQ